MADVSLAVVTFTKTEETAVRELLSRLYVGSDVFGPTVWAPTSLGEFALEGRLSDGRIARIEHRSLIAQGNVIAAAELSRSANAEERMDYYLFYGCCGAVTPDLVGQVFRVASVSYMSLGVVVETPDGEEVKLKNKWIVQTNPDEQRPLDTIAMPTGAPGTPGFVAGLELPSAHVLSTDKVIKRAPGKVPVPRYTGPTGPVYAKDEWTYGEAIAQYLSIAAGSPVLIDMETFGIASVMRAAGLGDRVIVLRVVTDALTDKVSQSDVEQLELLRSGSTALATAIADILDL